MSRRVRPALHAFSRNSICKSVIIVYTMNAVELYKKLPKTNCGKCSQKTCMPFAVAVLQGLALLSECPLLEAHAIQELEKLFTTSDWREDLIASLKLKVRNLDLPAITGDIGGTFRDGKLHIDCLGRKFTVSSGGEITTDGHITPWMRILLLHYITTHGKAELSGVWVSYSELKNGMVKASSFLREGEEPIRDLFDRNPERTSAILEKLGARRASGFPTPSAWTISLLPKVPVTVLYWPKEDEFPSTVKILFDRTADKFLDVESIIFLIEGFAKNIEMHLSRYTAP